MIFDKRNYIPKCEYEVYFNIVSAFFSAYLG